MSVYWYIMEHMPIIPIAAVLFIIFYTGRR